MNIAISDVPIRTLNELSVRLHKWTADHHGVRPPFWPLDSMSFDSVWHDAQKWTSSTSPTFDRRMWMIVYGTLIVRYDGDFPPDWENPNLCAL